MRHTDGEYCYGCRSNFPTDTGANMIGGVGGTALWIKASACTGTATQPTVTNCAEAAATGYCTLCNDGYIAMRTGTADSSCISRSMNTDYMDAAKLLHCLMIDSAGNC